MTKSSRRLRVGKGILMLLFPPECVGCGELMPPAEGAETVFCPFCQAQWEAGRLRREDRNLVWEGPFRGLSSVVKYRSGMTNGMPERLIYRLKHKDERRVFDYAAREMTPAIKDLLAHLDVPTEAVLISYPPRRRKAIRKDGFDQAKRLAEALSRETGWPQRTLLARSNRGSREQKTLDAAARTANATKAYRLSADVEDLSGLTVILVDDLYTTGATLRACAQLLIDAGADGVILSTVGRTEK